jgi:hypothetical protein
LVDVKKASIIISATLIIVIAGAWLLQNPKKGPEPKTFLLGYQSSTIKGATINTTAVIRLAKAQGYYVNNISSQEEAKIYGVDYPSIQITTQPPNPELCLTFDIYSNVTLRIDYRKKITNPESFFPPFLKSLDISESILDGLVFNEVIGIYV